MAGYSWHGNAKQSTAHCMFGRTLKRITPPAEHFTDVATRQTRIEARSHSESRGLAELLALKVMLQN